MTDWDEGQLLEIVQTRFDQVLEQIGEAAKKSGRSPSQITLLPVTKTVETRVLRAVYSLGYRDFAENRVQELVRKSEEMSDLSPTWQLIGHLQSNKANHAARIASTVQSVDSLRIAEALSKGASRAEKTLDLLVEVNTSGEEAKFGMRPSEVQPLLEAVSELPSVKVRGFMTMAPLTQDTDLIRRTFSDLRELQEKLAPSFEGSTVELRELSMGMSGDFPIAVEEGATIVRVGSALVGSL